MKKLNFNSYLTHELSKVIHSFYFNVEYVYRQHNKPGILVMPLFDDITGKDALQDLKDLCSSSKMLGHKYIISLEKISFKSNYRDPFREIVSRTNEYFELTMPNNPDFKQIVSDLEHLELDNLCSLKKIKKGGVKL